jgi:hypothetical protein
MACHTGRENGESIKKSTATFTNTGFINSHYLTAGATLFGVSGYEYYAESSGKYANPAFFAHDKIGIDDRNGTGTQGPCVTCHMTFNNDGKKHTFLPLTVERKDASHPLRITNVTGIASTACEHCHNGTHELTVAEFNEQKTLLREAMEAFEAQLGTRGIFFGEAYPYFYSTPFDPTYVESGSCSKNTAMRNWQLGGTTTFTYNATTKVCTPAVGIAGAAGSGKDVMGAAFNFNLIEHDPGAFVHNRFYVKRLIYDSIDLLDDGVLNSSVAATLDSATHAGKAYQAGATAYILGTGGARP